MFQVRTIIFCASITAFTALVFAANAAEFSSGPKGDQFSLSRRFIPHVLNFDDKQRETEWRSVERKVDFDSKLCALILVDVWNTNEISFERIDKITKDQIKPVVDACRKAGFLVVHAPGPPVADKYPQFRFHKPEPKGTINTHGSARDNRNVELEQWPTSEMLSRTGPFSPYSLRMETDKSQRRLSVAELYRNYVIHPAVIPEKEDMVICDKGELHDLLRDRKRFHLFYVGFAANGCLQERDYGVKSMNWLGYDVTLLRDCTTATETASSLATLEQTRASIENMEFWISTATSTDLLQALYSNVAAANDSRSQ